MLCYCVHFICRCAEFTSKSCSVRNNNTVLYQDISFSTNSYTFHLKSSKTDPFYQGVPIVIFCNNVLCRVASMRKFISRRKGASNSSPLFLDYDNCVLTRYRFITYLRHLLVRMSLATVCGVEWNVSAAAFTPPKWCIILNYSVRTKAYLQNSETCMRNLHW